MSQRSLSPQGALAAALLLTIFFCFGIVVLEKASGRSSQQAALIGHSVSGAVLLASGSEMLGGAGSGQIVTVPSLGSGDVLSHSHSGSIRLPIFLYHYVEVVADPKDTLRVRLAVTPQTFEEQLKTLQETGCKTLFVRQIPAILSGSLQVAHPVFLSFDDGYEDFYTQAFPLLKKYHARATLFLIADSIGKRDYLTEPQIQEMAHSGLVEIGSHTLTHPDLRTLTPQDLRQQVLDSKRDLEKRFHVSIRSFAYPFGFFNDAVVRAVRGAGYTVAVTTAFGTSQNRADVLMLHRVREMTAIGANTLQALFGI